MKIFPTILTDNIDTFRTQMKAIEGFSDEVDLDVMDGTLFGQKTLPLREMLKIETPLVRHLHLMQKDIVESIKLALEYGIRTAVVHAEADLSKIKFEEIPLQLGIALSPLTLPEEIETHLDNISSVQIMTVEPGAQGHTFLPDQLKKIERLRAIGFNGEIMVDGGVSLETIQEVEKAGADTVYIGSAIWKSESPDKTFKTLQEILQNN